MRDAEVAHYRVARGQKNVLRLDVAVDDALGMCVRQRVGDLLEQSDCLRSEDLDRHLATVLDILGDMDRRHSAAPGDFQHAVASGQRGTETIDWR